MSTVVNLPPPGPNMVGEALLMGLSTAKKKKEQEETAAAFKAWEEQLTQIYRDKGYEAALQAPIPDELTRRLEDVKDIVALKAHRDETLGRLGAPEPFVDRNGNPIGIFERSRAPKDAIPMSTYMGQVDIRYKQARAGLAEAETKNPGAFHPGSGTQLFGGLNPYQQNSLFGKAEAYGINIPADEIKNEGQATQFTRNIRSRVAMFEELQNITKKFESNEQMRQWDGAQRDELLNRIVSPVLEAIRKGDANAARQGLDALPQTLSAEIKAEADKNLAGSPAKRPEGSGLMRDGKKESPLGVVDPATSAIGAMALRASPTMSGIDEVATTGLYKGKPASRTNKPEGTVYLGEYNKQPLVIPEVSLGTDEGDMAAVEALKDKYGLSHSDAVRMVYEAQMRGGK